jgi:hypothetical protein
MFKNGIIVTSVFVIGIAMMPVGNIFANDLYIDENGGLSDSQVTDYAAPKASYSADGKTIVIAGQTTAAPSSVQSSENMTVQTQTFDDWSKRSVQTFDDGSTLIMTTDTDGNVSYSSTDSTDWATSGNSTKWPIKVYTSEIIPGADCWCVDGAWVRQDSANKACWSDIPVQKRKYECTVQPGLGSFQSMFASIIRYFVNIVLILGVLAIVGLGIAWSLAGWDDAKAKSSLKKWWINIVVGLIILFMFQYILKFLAPWIYQ